MATRRQRKKPNIILLGIDSLRRDHMSCYGYDRLTTPHIDRFAQEATLFEETFSAHIPTTSAYASMLTGRDTIGTQVVALRHKGPLRPEVPTLAEILKEQGYNTTCVGFTGNPSSRGFDTYLDYQSWGSWNEGRSPKAREPQRGCHSGAGSAGTQTRSLLPLPAPHGSARTLPAAGSLRAHVLPRQ